MHDERTTCRPHPTRYPVGRSALPRPFRSQFALLSHAWTDVVRVLLVAGARACVVGEKGWTALMAAAAEGHGKIVRELLLALREEGAEGGGEGVDARNQKGCTALIMASRNGFAGVICGCVRCGCRSPAEHNRQRRPTRFLLFVIVVCRFLAMETAVLLSVWAIFLPTPK